MSKDLRYSRTEKHIKRAFLELLKTKPYDKIKVADIIELAEISRNAFYLHYYSKDELLDSFIDSYANQFVEEQDIILKTNATQDMDQARKVLNAMLSPFFEDPETTTLLFKINNGDTVSKIFVHKMASYHYSKVDKEMLSPKEQLNIKLYTEYLAGGTVRMLRYNFQHGIPYTKDELVDLIHNINSGKALVDTLPVIDYT